MKIKVQYTPVYRRYGTAMDHRLATRNGKLYIRKAIKLVDITHLPVY